MEKLKILSSKDMLTGVMNRNEMNNYVDKLSNGKDGASHSVGIIFADLNGLKRVNDDYGHSEGDTLLKNAAKALEEVFEVNEIFRAGGDEFTIIILDVTEEELNEKVDALREISKNYKYVSFAIGSCQETNSSKVRQALRLADERMYEDKRLYYEAHPEMKR
jgi:diguanylate cyclase (GGDEF) domain